MANHAKKLELEVRRLHRLPIEAVNRIAAGEVIERPAAVVKELVENALDAGATRISIEIEHGGKSRIVITDDGCGMSRDDMLLAIERHATSKLTPDASGDYDLMNIETMGFRGEALPSIGAVARLSVTSRPRGGDEAWRVNVEGGDIQEPAPAAFSGHGARIEVADLFYATPARLKFLKSDQAETTAIGDVVRRLAMARADVAFVFSSSGRKILNLSAQDKTDTGRLNRLSAIMGKDFGDNAIPIEAVRDGARVSGFAGLPTFNRGLPDKQYSIRQWPSGARQADSGRSARRLCRLSGAGSPPRRRLYFSIFRLQTLTSMCTRQRRRCGSATLGQCAACSSERCAMRWLRLGIGRLRLFLLTRLEKFRIRQMVLRRPIGRQSQFARNPFRTPPGISTGLAERSPLFDAEDRPSARHESIENAEEGDTPETFPLGAARAQLHKTYIVSQSADGARHR